MTGLEPLVPYLLAATVATSVGTGISARQGQKQSLRRQKHAQESATSRAMAEAKRTEQERKRLNRKRPDIGSLLAEEQKAATKGAGGTLLTGPGGVGRNNLTLGGGRSYLGG